MSQGPFFGGFAQEHANNSAHGWFHVNDEDLIVVAYEDSAASISRQDASNLNWNHIVLHIC
jgi:hypothetical protein